MNDTRDEKAAAVAFPLERTDSRARRISFATRRLDFAAGRAQMRLEAEQPESRRLEIVLAERAEIFERQRDAARIRIKEREDELIELREFLRRRGRHSHECPATRSLDPCDCGLESRIKGPKPELAPVPACPMCSSADAVDNLGDGERLWCGHCEHDWVPSPKDTEWKP